MKVRVSFEIDVPLKETPNEPFNWNNQVDQIEGAIKEWFGKKIPDEYKYKVLDE
jgi:acyl carrier protein